MVGWYGFSAPSGGWHPFVDDPRSTETVAGKLARATRRTPTSVTSYTTDFILLRYVPRRDVGCRKPTACFSSFNILASIPHPPPSHLVHLPPSSTRWLLNDPHGGREKPQGGEKVASIDPKKVRLVLESTTILIY